MGLSSRRWQALMVDFRNLGLAALQQHTGDREETVACEAVSAPAAAPDQVFARSELRQKLQGAMKTLPARYRQVVKLYYERDLTMKEIGGLLGSEREPRVANPQVRARANAERTRWQRYPVGRGILNPFGNIANES